MSVQAIYNCPVKQAEQEAELKKQNLRRAVLETNGRDVYEVDFKNKKLISKKHYKAEPKCDFYKDIAKLKNEAEDEQDQAVIWRRFNRILTRGINYRLREYRKNNKIESLD